MKPMESCNRFFDCNSPICPFDEDRGLRIRLDNEEHCHLDSKKRRNLRKKLSTMA